MPTHIEWAEETWNPTVGCSRVSPGCDNCYAIRVAAREMQPAHKGLTTVHQLGEPYRQEKVPLDWTGEVRCLPDRLATPLHWRKPRRVFVDSMSDLFHPHVPDDFVRDVFQTMAHAPQHTFQVLTKRPQRMATLVDRLWRDCNGDVRINRHTTTELGIAPLDERWPLPNVWAGTSVEDQRYADLRIPHLIATPAAVRFLSIEPLLGPVDLTDYIEPDWIGSAAGGSGAPHPLIDWIIVGGESGPNARPMHPEWVRSISDQCVAAGVPFFFKQWGEWVPIDDERHKFWRGHTQFVGRGGETAICLSREERIVGRPDMEIMVKSGKKSSGREIDGRTWDEFPS